MSISKLNKLLKLSKIEESDLYNCNTYEMFLENCVDKYPKVFKDFEWYYFPEYNLEIGSFFKLFEESPKPDESKQVKQKNEFQIQIKMDKWINNE
jgi:hypothetical protein